MMTNGRTNLILDHENRIQNGLDALKKAETDSKVSTLDYSSPQVSMAATRCFTVTDEGTSHCACMKFSNTEGVNMLRY